MEATRVSQPVTSTLEGRVARCPTCASFTYDVAGLSDEEVRRLVLETEGRVLTRLVRRTDGRSMSVDCGHGTVRPMSPRRRQVLGVLVMLVAAVAGVTALRSRGAPDPVEVEPLPNDGLVSAPPTAEPAPSEAVPLDVGPPMTVVTPDLEDTAEPVAPEVVDEQHRGVVGDVHLADVTASWSKLEVQPGQLVELLESQLQPVRRCYGDALSVNRHYRGTLTAHLGVEKGGSVSRVYLPPRNIKGANAALQQCVEGALKGLRFAPRSSASVTFRLIFAGAR
ncbi:MAG: hypothetical protein Q8S33_32225 [Myxococcales bacterium]|nr:hypothetical protein [Myxococcales bacterium]